MLAYTNVRRAMVRTGYEMDSNKVKILEAGTTIEVIDRKVNEAGIGRLRYSEGWTSESMSTGEVTFQKQG